MTAAEYGTFALGYAGLTLAISLHTATIAEPYLVFSKSQWIERASAYLGASLWLNALIAICISGLCLLIGALSFASELTQLGYMAVGVGFAAPAAMMQRHVRITFYARHEPHRAALSSILYAVLAIGSMWLFVHREQLTPLTAFVSIMAGGIGGSVLIGLVASQEDVIEGRSILSHAMRQHASYGRWAIGSAVMSWAPWNGFYYVLGLARSIQEVSALKVVMTLLMPALQALWALAPLLIPSLGEAELRGENSLTQTRRLMIGLVGCSAIFGVLLAILREPLITHVFGDRYSGYSEAALLACAIPMIVAGIVVLEARFRALDQPKLIFRLRARSLLIGAIVGVPLTYFWGINGVILAQLLILTILLVELLIVTFRTRETQTRRSQK